MKKIKLFLIFISLTSFSCTMVSKDFYPEIGYRENPKVKEIPYTSLAKLNYDCHKQDNFLMLGNLYFGCSLIPFDPKEDCIIRYMEGHEKARRHELMHCHGYKDTFLPWDALKY